MNIGHNPAQCLTWIVLLINALHFTRLLLQYWQYGGKGQCEACDDEHVTSVVTGCPTMKACPVFRAAYGHQSKPLERIRRIQPLDSRHM